MPGDVPFFTNGVPAFGGILSGSEKIPMDRPGSISGSATVQEIGGFALTFLDLPNGSFSSDGATADFTAVAAQVGGAKLVVLELNGALPGDATMTLPGAQAIANVASYFFGGMRYVLRVINTSSAAHKWTLAGSADGTVTVGGTADVGQGFWREWLGTFNSEGTVLEFQNIGSGTK